ncbi:uncharacterized protein LOC127807384 isoform X2 [Diospyros lotus]|uniref:uncharacterized protein LOC127807384 isoform X2 n=1 Tax=Diospyros lotus TaxID=55363 RepID=UPI00224CEEF7|nr:uncharacterized protein LOC127807384 isoform X2 [Diospyros lotus]
MEAPPFLHHPPRYVPLSHRPPAPLPPPPPPPQSLSTDPNFYPRFLPPPPSAPLPPQSYRPLPPPPPLRPPSHQSQFTFLNHHPVEDFDFPRRHSSPPRVFNRPLFDDDRSRLRIHELDNSFPDPGPESWVGSPVVCRRFFDDQIPVSPFRLADNHRLGLEGSFRFRDGLTDAFEPNHSPEFLRSRSGSRSTDYHDDYVSSSSGPHRRSSFGDTLVDSNPNSSRDNGSNMGSYESFHGMGSDSDRFRRKKNIRWTHDLPPSRDFPDAPVETKTNEFGEGDGEPRLGFSRRAPQSYGTGRFVSRGSREGKQDFRQSPRKKIQKKSALLRIQYGKSHNRNRNDEYNFPSARTDNSDPSRFRSRGSFIYSNNRMEEDREGSPVELDVSFKSNALVAKAVVTSTSNGTESDRNLQPGNKKFADLLNLPPTKLSHNPVKSNSPTNALDCPSISCKNPKQSRENVMDFSGEAVRGFGSQSCSSGTISSHGYNTPKELVSHKHGTVDLDGISSLRSRKKNKVVSTLSRGSRSRTIKKNAELVKEDRSTTSLPAASQAGEDDMQFKEKKASSSMVLVDNIEVQPYSNGLTEHNKVDEFLGVIVSAKAGADIDSGGSHIWNMRGEGNISSPLLGSSSPLKTKVDVGTVTEDTKVELNAVSSSDRVPVELYISSPSEFFHMDHISQRSQNEPPVILQNDLFKESLESKLPIGDDVNHLLRPQEIKVQKGPLNLHSNFHEGDNASNSENGLTGEKLNDTVANVYDVNAGAIFKETALLVESAALEGLPRSIPSIESNGTFGLSSAKETIKRGFDASVCIHNESTALASNSVVTNSEWKRPVCKIGFVDNNSHESCPAGLIKTIPVDGLSEPTMSCGGNLHVNVNGCSPNKRKDREIPLELLSPSKISLLVNEVSTLHPVATTLSCPVEDFSSAEHEVMILGAGNNDTVIACTDKDNIVHWDSSTKGYLENDLSVKRCFEVSQNATSPNHMKKRKVSESVSPSPLPSETQEEPVSAGFFMHSVEVPSSTDGNLIQSEDGVMVSNMDTVFSSGFPLCSESTTLLLGNTEVGASRNGLVGEGCNIVVSKLEQRYPYPLGVVGEQKEKDSVAIMTRTNNQFDTLDTEKARGENIDASKTDKEPGILCSGTVQQRIPLGTLSPAIDQTKPVTDVEYDSCLLVKDGLPSLLNTLSTHVDGNDISDINLPDEMEPEPMKLSNQDPTEKLSTISASRFKENASDGQVPSEKGCEDVTKTDKLVFEGHSPYSLNTSLQDVALDKKSGHTVGLVHSIISKVGIRPQDGRKTSGWNSMGGEINIRKNQLASAVPRGFPSHLSLKKTETSSCLSKPRTWHRVSNPAASSFPGKKSYTRTAAPHWQSPSGIGKNQNASYIRKGNSLVRKPSPAAAPLNFSHASGSSVYRLNSMGIDGLSKGTVVESKVNGSDPLICSSTGQNSALERPQTPPLPNLSNSITLSSGNGAPLPLADSLVNGCSITESDPSKHKENPDLPKPFEDAPNSFGTHDYQNGQTNNSGSQNLLEDGNSVSLETKKIVYLKRKSNQLVAASSSSDTSIQNVDKAEAPSSDGYYKRKRNQLIRKSLEVTVKVNMSDDTSKLEGKSNLQVSTSSSSRQRPGKGLAKAYKPSKYSLVWTLRDAYSLKKDNPLLHQVWPHLFPWKRATYLRSVMHNSASVSNYNSLSAISRKLLLSRKRETIYTRSARGLSLRKSKVLSVGRSSLKWSKSIEKNSRKANEEATLAVAAVQKKKREKSGVNAVSAGTKTPTTKNRNHSFRERVFRVGSVRYKMDPTRRTLQRIADEESPCSVTAQSEKEEKKSPVPKRLLIGNHEYVRIGNGNQLIRDPKKRTRILASEKVRWSLHTARLRLARKRKYCQFFTRFGKCNKDDGKCPYIHDPSKIAVCTKFLKGSCTDPNCKLTHQVYQLSNRQISVWLSGLYLLFIILPLLIFFPMQVIPDRMQDCSYFLQGLCTNESCPYRHVNVNPNASICEGFLKGYCADGNECRKKHSYVCPVFEAGGVCPLGSKCKLHHPKKRNKGKKKNPCGEQKNARGRYFGSMQIDTSECQTAVAGKQTGKDGENIFFEEGRFADYIHLDGSDEEEAGDMDSKASEETTTWNGGATDLQLDDDNLIRPVYILSKHLMTELCPAVCSPSEKTGGDVSEESSCK